MLHIGDISITLINESSIKADAGGPFGLVPRALWGKFYPYDDENRVAMHHVCLLVRAAGKTILVDNGNGHKLDPKRAAFMELEFPEGGLVPQLEKLGVKAGEVDIVIDTHLHGDHCGGNTYREGEEVKATFPNAEYVVQRLEYADAYLPNERTRGTYYRENFVPLLANGQMRLLDGDTEIVPGVRTVLTPGHTPGHQSVIIESGGECALFVSDLASFSIHFLRLAWMTAYDVLPLVTLETKRVWQRWALEKDALLIFQHDPLTYAGRLTGDLDRPELAPLLGPGVG
jgi:glyoxylase-like metal-dependent hydrolase (beta-lactamase superfamily II)